MKTETEILNKIKWTEKDTKKYTIEYQDLDKTTTINYDDIKKIEGTFMMTESGGKETMIPLHRIRAIKKDNETIWKRTK